MKILVTGAHSQVGRALCRLLAARDIPYEGCGSDGVDITDGQQIEAFLDRYRPDYLVNGEVVVDTDSAERDSDYSHRVHRDAVAHLARCCAERNIVLVQLSTDQVFDGTKTTAYTETDTPNPINVYGQSLWAGEEAIRELWGKHIILRTAWVFGPDGDNMLKRILQQASDNETVRVPGNERGCPTPAQDVARVIVAMLEQVDCDVDPPLWGTYHYVGSDVTDWPTFAETVIKAAKSYGDLEVERVEAVNGETQPRPTPRPANAELSTRKILSTFGIKQQPWRRGVQDTLKSMYEPLNGAVEPGR